MRSGICRLVLKHAFNFTGIMVPILFLSKPAITVGSVLTGTTSDQSFSIPIAISVSPMTEDMDEDELPSNAPLKSCGSAGGVEDGEYLEVFLQYMDPVCEDVQGYCRLKRNQNYTAILGFTPKVNVQSLTVRVTTVQQPYGWETLFWPEYGICGRFNLTCPQESDVPVRAHNHDKVPDRVPPTRGLFRLRLLGTSSEDETKKPYLCRQIYLQFY